MAMFVAASITCFGYFFYATLSQTVIPPSITLYGVMRDQSAFNRDFHGREDDDTCMLYVEGLVESTLFNGNPCFVPPILRNSTSLTIKQNCYYTHSKYAITSRGNYNFNEYYRDVPGHNIAYNFNITLPLNPSTGLYTYTQDFFPLDTQGFYREQCDYTNPPSVDCKLTPGNVHHNYLFATEISARFYYKGGEVFTFGADDDMRVWINGVLQCDLGNMGPHHTCNINMDSLNLSKNSINILFIAHAERHATGSYYYLTTTSLPANNIPQAMNLSVLTNENIAVNITLLGSDKDPTAVLSYLIISPPPALGLVYCKGSPAQSALVANSVINCSNGLITYSPKANVYGHDIIYFLVTDGIDNSSLAMINVTINKVNSPPVGHVVSVSQEQFTTATYFLNITDNDTPLSSLSLHILEATTLGTLTFGFNDSVGNFYFTYQAVYVGIESMKYTILDTTDSSLYAMSSIFISVTENSNPVQNGSYIIYQDVRGGGLTVVTLILIISACALLALILICIVVFYIYSRIAKSKYEDKWRVEFRQATVVINPMYVESQKKKKKKQFGTAATLVH